MVGLLHTPILGVRWGERERLTEADSEFCPDGLPVRDRKKRTAHSAPQEIKTLARITATSECRC